MDHDEILSELTAQDIDTHNAWMFDEEIDVPASLTPDQIEEMEREMEREQLREYKKFALDQWLDLYHEIESAGFIEARTCREDYRDVPTIVRRTRGFPIDAVASHLGFDYIDDFYAHIVSSHRLWKQSVGASQLPAGFQYAA